MSLHLGTSENLKIYINNTLYSLKMTPDVPIVNNILLVSADNYILKDVNGLYLTVEKEK